MAQGQLKKTKAPAAKISQRKQSGSRVIKPKKESLIKQQQMKKKHSAGLAALTEKALASRAGHLEILKGGKKDRKSEQAKGSQAKKGR